MVEQSVLNSVQKYIREIPDDLTIKKIFLFGSYAKGTAREGSDIDLAVVIRNMNDFFDVQKRLMKIRRNIDLRIEPHPIDENDFTLQNPFAYEIMKTGMEIFAKL